MSFINRDPTTPLTVESAQHFQKYDPAAKNIVAYERVQLNEAERLITTADRALPIKLIVPLGPDATAARDGFTISPPFACTVTDFQVVAASDITGTSAEVTLNTLDATEIATTGELVSETLADTVFDGVVDDDEAVIPASTPLKVSTALDTTAGGRGLTAIVTLTRN